MDNEADRRTLQCRVAEHTTYSYSCVVPVNMILQSRADMAGDIIPPGSDGYGLCAYSSIIARDCSVALRTAPARTMLYNNADYS